MTSRLRHGPIPGTGWRNRITAAFRGRRQPFLPPDVAIDFGTANTLIAVVGRGIVYDEPTVAAIDTARGRIRAIGTEAKQMRGRTPPGIETIQPLRGGVIAELEVAEAMLSHHIRNALSQRTLLRPRVAISIPAKATSIERRAIGESARASGARTVFLVPESMASALGAGLPVLEPRGQLIVDIGGGTTEVAVLALGGVVESQTIPVAGQAFDEAITNYLRWEHNLLVGPGTVEALKIEIGCAIPPRELRKAVVRGRDLVKGAPRGIEISADELVGPLGEPLGAILNAIQEILEVTPPELASDVVSGGIHLAGGASQLAGLASLIERHSGLAVHPVEPPGEAVLRGCLRCLEEPGLLEQIRLPER